MTSHKITRILYGALGILYVAIGAGSMVLPLGWLPESLTTRLVAGEALSSFLAHLLQEFGTVVLALGLVFLWCASRKEYSRGLHLMLTLYLSLDAFIHWVGPDGLIGSWPRGIVNSIPLVLMLLVGVLQRRASE